MGAPIQSIVGNSPVNPALLRLNVATFNLNAAAGSYTLFTASGGDVWVEIEQAFVKVAAAGLTSALIETNHGAAAKSIVASALLAAITVDLVMTLVTTKFVLPSGKIIRGTIAGTGSGGSILLVVKWAPLATGALLV